MVWLAALLAILMACFGLVLLRGAPYLPTLTKQVGTALDMIDLKPGQTMLELGCGDGKVLIAAAERGLIAIGYELNPILAFVAWLRTRRYGRRVKVVWGDFWLQKLPPAEAIFVFLLDPYMEKLHKKIVQSYDANVKNAISGSSKKPSRKAAKTLKLVSFAFEMPHVTAVQKKDGLFLYEYDLWHHLRPAAL